MIVAGFVGASAAIGLMAVFGTSGEMVSGLQPIASSAPAVVSDVSTIQNTGAVAKLTGWPVIGVAVSPETRSTVFVGIARSSDVDRYLAGVASDRVADLSLTQHRLTLDRVSGSNTAPPPVDQTFWLASATSATTAEITWPVQDGNYRIVIMNADGGAWINVDTVVKIVLPQAFSISLGTLGAGIVLVVGGTLVLVRATTAGVRTDRYRQVKNSA
jgi:hypothetical protein